jgi:Holliday junction resolvasome RuvABC endonuclease subunit
MRILGIDGGMTRLGIGAVEIVDGKLSLITHGVIRNPRDPERTFNHHLNTGIAQIANDFPRVLDLARPDLILSEYIPAGKLGSNDALVIAAVTTCKVIAHQWGIEWRDIAANSAKKQLTGDHKATKTLVRNTVFELFPLVEARHMAVKAEQKERGEKADGIPQDTFDAIGIAVVGASLYGNSNDEDPDVPRVQSGKAGDSILTDS